MDDAVKYEKDFILSLSPKDAIDYMAWRYRRTREVLMAHNMTDEEIEKEAREQYKKLKNER